MKKKIKRAIGREHVNSIREWSDEKVELKKEIRYLKDKIEESERSEKLNNIIIKGIEFNKKDREKEKKYSWRKS